MAPRKVSSPAALTRRRFVSGLAGAVFGADALWPALAAARTSEAPAILSGDTLNLVIASMPFNVTGRPRLATAINGMVPAPTLRMRQGDTVTIHVTNRLSEDTSLHWHGLRLPADQDGVPGLTFPGIRPGETFSYRFKIRQGGTYWYHSHSGMQEQTGLQGALVLVPQSPEPYSFDRDYVVMLTDWTDEDPMSVIANLKQQSDYYDFHRPTLSALLRTMHRTGVASALRERRMWNAMRMSPSDIMDVTGATYTFLLNGQPPARGWTGLFRPGERVRLRFINGSSMTTFDVRIPGLPLTVVAADGNDIEPVSVGEFRIGVAETYDVIVQPLHDAAYTVFAQAEDRSGYARGTLAPRPGMTARVPPMDPRPVRSMLDMGMAMTTAKGKSMAGMNMPGMDMPGMDMSNMPGMSGGAPAPAGGSVTAIDADGTDPRTLRHDPFVDHIATHPRNRLGEPGDGLEDNGRRVLVYTDLRALHPDADPRPPARDLVFHLTGNMQRFVWGFDGRRFAEAAPVRLRLGERVRFVLINDTMMEHPIHLHGFLFSLENGQSGHLPLKHTVNVKPNEQLSFVFTADTPGHWAFHCHLLYHMEAGMFRTVLVA